ncbi:CLOCK-interacting pacemaker [Gouania willdenowi]|uniref:CLOCK-interacting pacemaker-like n=1 Tax=Gouania willdenowi TaxID=441366 RepID=A0A8C5GJN3_GOUWI|nr:CLOCK-interacting pacemaker-like [Gouania willdenowi]
MSAKRKAEIHHKGANRPRVMKSAGSRTDSERDSGFSDASSEHMSMMDTDLDSPHSVVQRSPQAKRSSQRESQSSQLAVVGGSYSSLSPMIIMNNVLLKQPRDSPPALKPWRFSPTVEVVQPVVQQPQVVFIQPVVSRQASPLTKESKPRHRRPNKYLPILKSYPKIAPHPGDSFSSSSSSSSSSSGRGTAASSSSHTSSSSSSSSRSERCGALTPNHQEHCQRENVQRSLSSSANNSASTTPSLSATATSVSSLLQSRLSLPTTESSTSHNTPSSLSSSFVSQAELTSTHSTGSRKKALHAAWINDTLSECTSSDNDTDTKRKRFCNTYNILNQSGLLDITLRTKELLRQNRRTQSDLDRLKEQTDLFFQVLTSGDTGLCVKLQASLQDEEREKKKEMTFEQRKNRLDEDLGSPLIL